MNSLQDSNPIKLSKTSNFPTSGGCYVLIERNKNLYVGIAKNIRRRMRNHISGRPEQSAFALKLARKAASRKPTYKKKGGIKELMKDSIFSTAMKQTTSRVKGMSARFVVIDDDVALRYLFEFYAAVTLKAPYNDFNTH